MSQEAFQIVAVIATAAGALSDWRSGKIPNAITIPLLVGAPAAAFAVGGTSGFLDACLGACFCGIVPFFAFRAGGMGGGDVKLFAAVGALLGPWLGIEAQFYAMIAASIASLVLLARRRKLVQAFSNIFFLAFNRVLPKKWRREVTPELQSQLRIGPYIFVGTAAAVLTQHPTWMGMRP